MKTPVSGTGTNFIPNVLVMAPALDSLPSATPPCPWNRFLHSTTAASNKMSPAPAAQSRQE